MSNHSPLIVVHLMHWEDTGVSPRRPVTSQTFFYRPEGHDGDSSCIVYILLLLCNKCVCLQHFRWSRKNFHGGIRHVYLVFDYIHIFKGKKTQPKQHKYCIQKGALFHGRSHCVHGTQDGKCIMRTEQSAFVSLSWYLTLRKIVIWMSKNCQKLDIVKNCLFFQKVVSVNFLVI